MNWWSLNPLLISSARLAACLAAHLPANLLSNLPRNDSTSDLLLALSDGQLLCIAYNAVLRASHRPWGFIPESSIHDVISLTRERKRAEEAATRDGKAVEDTNHLSVAGSTPMRRSSSEGLSNDGSLMPNVNADGTRRVGLTFRRLENLRLFVGALRLRYLVQMSPNIDLKAIARKTDGWEDMLKEIACAWVNAAAEEKRNEEPDSD